MTAPPKRHWFRFGRRTLFVVVTLTCIALGWLVWQMQVVTERQSVVAEIDRVFKQTQGHSGLPRPLEEWEHEIDNSSDYDYARVSQIRIFLGDRSYVKVKLPARLDSLWIHRAELAFPEAELRIIDNQGSQQFGDEPFRDSLYKPTNLREKNRGTWFKTGLIEK